MPTKATSDAVRDAQGDWVRRVLGVAMAGPAPDAGARDAGMPDGVAAEFATASAGWTAAMTAVGQQVDRLKAALLASGDDDYEDIASIRLQDVIGEGPGAMSALLGQVGQDARAVQEAAGPALKALDQLLADVKKNETITVCDANPVRAPVAIRATLLPAMQRLQGVLRRAAA